MPRVDSFGEERQFLNKRTEMHQRGGGFIFFKEMRLKEPKKSLDKRKKEYSADFKFIFLKAPDETRPDLNRYNHAVNC